MTDEKCYYFDTNVLLEHYHSEKYQLQTEIRRLSGDNSVVYISNLTYLELLGVLMRYHRDKKIRKKPLDRIIEQVERDVGTSSRHRFQLVPAQEGIFHAARILMRTYGENYALGTNDALHIAMAKMIPNAVMVTSDGGRKNRKMKGVCHSIGLEVLDPELPDPAEQVE